jgi:ATP-binding cassette subfamily B protein
LTRVLKYLVPYKGLIGLILFCVLMSALIGLIPPLVVKTIIDRALPQKDLGLLGWLVVALLALPIAEGLLVVLQQYLNTRIGQSIMRDLRVELFRHIHRMSLRFFTATKTGEIVSRLNNDVNGIQDVITRIFINIASNVIVIASTIVLMFSLDWRLALFSSGVLPLFIIPVRKVGQVRQRLRRRAQEKYSEINSILQETFGISGAMLLKIFVREDAEGKRFAERANEVKDLEVRVSLVGRWFAMFVSLASPFSAALVFWYGGKEAIAGAISIGTIIAFTAYLGRLYSPLSQLLNVHIDLLTSLALFERIFEYLDLELEIKDKPGARAISSVKGHIVFDRVSFAYGPDERVLKDISFEAQPAQLIALVGPSGSGKTTIAYLLMRLYDPIRGSVQLDGHDLKDLSVRSLRAVMGMAMQEPFLFHATIRENLLYGRPDATEEQIIAACQAARIHDLIARLPEGYHTMVGERGYKLSGGEKQRIALARVFLKDPPILILDEATASVDLQSEAYIQAAMENLMRGRTTLVIAHRLSTILAADKILVLDRGAIIQSGTHQQLAGQDGLYSTLYRQQFSKQPL